VLAKTIKGYGLGEAGEGRNITHQAKKLQRGGTVRVPLALRHPISDDEGGEVRLHKPSEDSKELHYLKQRRAALGGWLPGGGCSARLEGAAARQP